MGDKGMAKECTENMGPRLEFYRDTRHLTVGKCFIRPLQLILSQGRIIPARKCYLGQVEAIAAHHCCAEDHGQGVCYILAGNVRC